MTLVLNPEISRYYAESLVLLFFPGEKFPDTPNISDNVVLLDFDCSEEQVSGYAKITYNNEEFEGNYIVKDIIINKNLIQRAIGGAFLNAGKKIFGCIPPWGMMTGVRPAKTAIKYLNKYNSNAAQFMSMDYLCSIDKSNLAINTAINERDLINNNKSNYCSLYIAIPFCPSKCSYCSFTSFSSDKLISLIPSYVDKLCKEIEYKISLINDLGLKIKTIYFGGGTPSILNDDQLIKIFNTIFKYSSIHELNEITFEAGRPDTITASKLSILKFYGVDRISVNCQVLDDKILNSIGRNHTVDDFYYAYELVNNSNIGDINVDLIAGLPNCSFEIFKNSVDNIIKLSPSNITVHTFYIKRAANINKDKSIYNIENITAINSIDYSLNTLSNNGYIPYYLYKQKNTISNLENTGFCKPNHICKYNIYMMEEVHSVFGVGASSMTKLVSNNTESKILRLSQTKYPYEYLDNDLEQRLIEDRNKILNFYKENIL